MPVPVPVSPTTGLFNAIKEAATRLDSRVEGVALFGDKRCGGAGWKEGETDRLTIGVRAVKFADGFAGVGDGVVGDICGSGGAARAVVAEGEGLDGSNAIKKVLWRGTCSAGWGGDRKGGLGYSSLWDERLREVTYV